jgi:hypothetical protein
MFVCLQMHTHTLSFLFVCKRSPSERLNNSLVFPVVQRMTKKDQFQGILEYDRRQEATDKYRP